MQGKDIVTWGILIWIGWQIANNSGAGNSASCADAGCGPADSLQGPRQGPGWMQCDNLTPFTYQAD